MGGLSRSNTYAHAPKEPYQQTCMYHVPIAAFHVKQEFYDNKKRYILPTDPKIVVLPATYVRFFFKFR